MAEAKSSSVIDDDHFANNNVPFDFAQGTTK